jgi:uncharacterized protein YndB with AHSA1/START domain
VTEPLLVNVEVACPVEHAFRVWTTKIDAWWPADHTVSGRADAQIVLERHVGGRLLELLPDGTEHVWGEVTVWQPPHELAYRWHIGRPAAQATDVHINFVAVADDATRLQISHRGWDNAGDQADQLRQRNQSGWRALLAGYLPIAEKNDPPDEE